MATSFAGDVGGAFDVRGFGDLQTRLRAMSYLEVRCTVPCMRIYRLDAPMWLMLFCLCVCD